MVTLLLTSLADIEGLGRVKVLWIDTAALCDIPGLLVGGHAPMHGLLGSEEEVFEDGAL